MFSHLSRDWIGRFGVLRVKSGMKRRKSSTRQRHHDALPKSVREHAKHLYFKSREGYCQHRLSKCKRTR